MGSTDSIGKSDLPKILRQIFVCFSQEYCMYSKKNTRKYGEKDWQSTAGGWILCFLSITQGRGMPQGGENWAYCGRLHRPVSTCWSEGAPSV